MARKLSINGDSRAIAARIARLESFTTHGNMHGERPLQFLQMVPSSYAGWLRGSARDRWVNDGPTIDYVVWSYNTPILWHAADGWVRIGHSFSISSAKHAGRAAMYSYAGDGTYWPHLPEGFDDRETLLQVSYGLSERQYAMLDRIRNASAPVRTRDITGQASRTLTVLYRMDLVRDTGGVLAVTAKGAEVWS